MPVTQENTHIKSKNLLRNVTVITNNLTIYGMFPDNFCQVEQLDEVCHLCNSCPFSYRLVRDINHSGIPFFIKMGGLFHPP
ncbi:MAG: hypothetical protein A2X59_02875 [Nitrospirae bacterium GWC2_42_7]|nr:MAG: hypothetical protein A2X59_02875 [Nitrospirae bacterium GWC2_42_7]